MVSEVRLNYPMNVLFLSNELLGFVEGGLYGDFFIIHIVIYPLQRVQISMAVFFGTSWKVTCPEYNRQVTFYKLLEKHGHVHLVTKYILTPFLPVIVWVSVEPEAGLRLVVDEEPLAILAGAASEGKGVNICELFVNSFEDFLTWIIILLHVIVFKALKSRNLSKDYI